jgi:two-component system chemotaxis sensor kinase CheA
MSEDSVASIPKEALAEYIGETREMCQRISIGMGLVEKNQHDDETLNSIYRDMHSIKGGSHLFGFKRIGQLAHAMETALDPVRHKEIILNPKLVDALYQGLDAVSRILSLVEMNGDDSQMSLDEIGPVVQKIADLTLQALNSSQVVETKDHDGSEVSSNSRLKRDDSLVRDELDNALKLMVSNSEIKINETSKDRRESISLKDEFNLDPSTVRIPVGLLDNLMNLVGELVLVRNQMLQFSQIQRSGEFLKLSQRLSVVTSEIQNDVMKTRMQPIGPFLAKFHRLVRDLARDLGKSVDFRIEGADTELDKTLIEAVKDPLTHLIRNSIDHGIESPADRQRVGKHPIGTVMIKSYHEGGHVIIEVTDDGPGLSPVKIAKKAVERGLVLSEQVGKMSANDIRALIFLPGFSTAESVTDISGRGVGMDVVKTNIERIGGHINLESTVGVGTTVRMSIPLTLAIIPALMVSSSGQSFAIPQSKVIELVRIEDSGRDDQRIQWLQGQAMIRLRGKLLPVVSLSAILKGQPASDALKAARLNNLVILRSEGQSFALAVDEVVDNTDIVVKPLAQVVKSVSAYSGATVMGDGSVVLILDVDGLSRLSLVATVGKLTSADDQNLVVNTIKPDSAEYLLLDLGVPGLFAAPLCLVNRLEVFSPSDVQFSGDLPVVRYRETLLPILSIAERLGFASSSPKDLLGSDKFSVIVVSKANRLFGLAVKKILDVVSIDLDIDGEISDRSGILGSVVFGKNVISVIDVLGVVDSLISGLPARVVDRGSNLAPTPTIPARPSMRTLDSRTLKILLAEDTSFFRRYVSAYLRSLGHEVVAATNGDDAFRRLEMSHPSEFDLVLTDIEMPILDGFSLMHKIRMRPEFSGIPVIALTTKFHDSDIKKGKEAGFSAYLEKLNAELLEQTIKNLFDVKQAV